MYIDSHTKYYLFLTGFIKILAYQTNISKIIKYQFESLSSGNRVVSYGRINRRHTEKTKLTDAFNNFAKEPKNFLDLRSHFEVNTEFSHTHKKITIIQHKKNLQNTAVIYVDHFLNPLDVKIYDQYS